MEIIALSNCAFHSSNPSCILNNREGLLEYGTKKRGSYGFRFQENPYPFVMNLWNVGWEIESDGSYHWDGRKRLENEKKLSFNTRFRA